MMDMYGGMMGANTFGSGAMLLAWVTWLLLVVLMVTAIRWFWNHGEK